MNVSKMHLQLFADGGAEENAAEGTLSPELEAEFQKIVGSAGVAAPQVTGDKDLPRPVGETGKPQSGRNAESADRSKEERTTTFLTGNSAEETSLQEEQDAAVHEEDPEKDFEELIKGKYKEQFGKRVQGIINPRFAKAKKTEAELAATKDAIALLYRKYKVQKGDIPGLKAAIENDRTNFSKMAMEMGVSIDEAQEEFASIRETERANEEQERQQEEEERQQEEADAEREAAETKAIFDAWRAEEAEIKKTDPSFSLGAEIEKYPDFKKALDAGLGVKFAYNAVHHEEIMAKVAGAVAENVSAATARSIANRQSRPSEGALRGAATSAPGTKNYMEMSDREFMKLFKSMGY